MHGGHLEAGQSTTGSGGWKRDDAQPRPSPFTSGWRTPNAELRFGFNASVSFAHLEVATCALPTWSGAEALRFVLDTFPTVPERDDLELRYADVLQTAEQVERRSERENARRLQEATETEHN